MPRAFKNGLMDREELWDQTEQTEKGDHERQAKTDQMGLKGRDNKMARGAHIPSVMNFVITFESCDYNSLVKCQ